MREQKPSRWHRFQSWLYYKLFPGEIEHMSHLIDDVIRLEEENQYLRDIVRPNSAEINIPSVRGVDVSSLAFKLTTNVNPESKTIYHSLS